MNSLQKYHSSEQPDPKLVEVLRAVQNRLSWADRNLFAREIGGARRSEFANVFAGDSSDELLNQLKDKGICKAPIHVGGKACEDVIAYFSQLPCYNEHVDFSSDGVARSVAETAKIANYGSYKLENTLRAPYILELALQPALLDLASGYLECIPSIYSINTFWSFPSHKVGHTQSFHYDEDDFRFLSVFVYWNGIEQGEGEFYFVEKSHDIREVSRRIKEKRWARLISRALRAVRGVDEFRRVTRKRRNETLRYLFPNEITCVRGPAGTAIAVDTFGLHRGSLPSTKPRLCTWIRYGLYANWGYGSIKTVPVSASLVNGRIPTNDVNKFITRLMLDWNR
jgi:hypothetical protein